MSEMITQIEMASQKTVSVKQVIEMQNLEL